MTVPVKAGLLSGADVWNTRAAPAFGVPSIKMSDGPHGVRLQPGDADNLGIGGSEPATCFPTAATLSNTWDEDLLAEIGAALGAEALARDVQVLLGPGLNIKRSPLGGRNFEYFSEDPELAGRLAAAMVRGIQSQSVAACPKHFAANSQEAYRLVQDSVVDERTLREIYLTAFEIVVREARPWAVMSSYNRLNGTFTNENRRLLVDILRGEWGFDGTVVSDWGGGNDPVAAVAAGGGLEMPSPGWDSARRIEDAVLTGTLAETDLDARVLEMLQLVERVTGAGAAGAHDAADVETTHHALARRAAAEGAVLLRNDGVLPLARGTRVALLGEYADQPRYQGAGSSLVNPTRLTSLRGAAQALVAEGTIELVGATGAAADADPEVIVLAMAIPPEHESEGLDRPHLRLPEDQIVQLRQAAASGVPVVVTLAGGGLVEMPWLDDCAALVHGYLGGQAGGEAMWDVLTGQVDPGGRLAESLPESYPVPSQGPQAVYAEGRHVGYRAGTGSPAFGAGLSYTTFSYSDLEVSQDAAAVTVTNTGARSGSEVVQMYVRRELLELKGFTKVRLEPGESARVTLPFTERTFRSFDVASGSWVVVAGEYEVLVGHDSTDLALSATVVRDGVTGPVVGQTSTSGPGNTSPAGTTPGSTVPGSTVPSDPEPDTEPADWGVPPFTENTPLDQAVHSPSRLVRAIVGELLRRRDRSMGAGHPDLEVLFIAQAPFRVLHKMTRLPREMAVPLLRVADGHVLAGLARVAWGFVHGTVANHRMARRFRRGAGVEHR